MISLKNTLKLLVSLFLLMVSASQAGTSMTYIHTDHLGSPIAATDEAGQVKWTEEYQPFGVQRTNQDSDNNTGFTGHQYDDELELTYMQARWYHPEVGRFMALDPLLYRDVYSFNRYVYANDNPYKYVDPDGRKNESTFDMHVMYNHFGQSGVERYKNNRVGVDKYLMPVIPGAGVGDILADLKQGNYLDVAINAAMELPFAKLAKLGKLDAALSPNVKKVLDAIEEKGYEVKFNPKNLTTQQEVNATIDFGDKTKVNLRVETHPLKPNGPGIRHANVEVTRQVKNKNKVIRNDHIVD